MSDAIKPAYWMTFESRWRMAQGGNSKGAVPVHGKRSVTADIPLYDQATLDAAIAAERERWVSICQDHASRERLPHKKYETYVDGWLDACNEIMWAGDKPVDNLQQQ